MTTIDTTALTKHYGDTVAVDDLDLSIPEGVVYGFLGSNGARKTTTMRMLTGLTRPTSGTGSVAGVAITDRDGLRSYISYLPEEPPLYEQATAYERLEYIAGLGKLPLRISLLRSTRRAQPKHKQRADDDNHPLTIVQ